MHGRGKDTELVVNSPSGLLKDSALSGDDAAVRLCPTGALALKAAAFGVPIGERAYDREPISEVELREYRNREVPHG